MQTATKLTLERFLRTKYQTCRSYEHDRTGQHRERGSDHQVRKAFRRDCDLFRAALFQTQHWQTLDVQKTRFREIKLITLGHKRNPYSGESAYPKQLLDLGSTSARMSYDDLVNA